MDKNIYFWIVLGASITITVILMVKERTEKKRLGIPKNMRNMDFYKNPVNKTLAIISMLLVIAAGIIMFAVK